MKLFKLSRLRVVAAFSAVLGGAVLGGAGGMLFAEPGQQAADERYVAYTTAHGQQLAEKRSSSENSNANGRKKTVPARPAGVQKLGIADAPPRPPLTAPLDTNAPAENLLYIDPMFARLGRPAEIASQPAARWFGNWTQDVRGSVHEVVSAAAGQNRLPVLVAYNIPLRDCGSYSAGGANGPEAYRQWIRAFASGIGQREAIVVLEPDALAGMDCLNTAARQARLANLTDAVNVFKASTDADVYIDAGNATWHSAGTMADRLRRANVAGAAGFAVNVSNFISTSQSVSYGEALGATLGKRYVVDTSRNGNGAAPAGQWCNPRGRALGEHPRLNPGPSRAAAYLWVKTPGESDGTCNGGPAAGMWWPEYAAELIRNAR